MIIDRFISWLYTRRVWGPRCDEDQLGCPCCDKWREHDELFNPNALPTEDEFDPRVRINSENMTDVEKMDAGFNGKTYTNNGIESDF